MKDILLALSASHVPDVAKKQLITATTIVYLGIAVRIGQGHHFWG